MNTQPRNDRNLLSEFVVRVRLHEGHLVCLWLGLVASHLSLSLSSPKKKRSRHSPADHFGEKAEKKKGRKGTRMSEAAAQALSTADLAALVQTLLPAVVRATQQHLRVLAGDADASSELSAALLRRSVATTSEQDDNSEGSEGSESTTTTTTTTSPTATTAIAAYERLTAADAVAEAAARFRSTDEAGIVAELRAFMVAALEAVGAERLAAAGTTAEAFLRVVGARQSDLDVISVGDRVLKTSLDGIFRPFSRKPCPGV